MLLNKMLQYHKIIYNRFLPILTMSIFLIISANCHANEISSSEIKASWIHNIVDWVDWKTRPKNQKPTICTVGRDKVYMYLRRMEMSNKIKKGGNDFFVQNKATEDDLSQCYILYISESEQEYYTNILESINGKKGIVSISSIVGFARKGGSIEFVIKKKARLIMNIKTVNNSQTAIDEELYSWIETIQ